LGSTILFKYSQELLRVSLWYMPTKLTGSDLTKYFPFNKHKQVRLQNLFTDNGGKCTVTLGEIFMFMVKDDACMVVLHNNTYHSVAGRHIDHRVSKHFLRLQNTRFGELQTGFGWRFN